MTKTFKALALLLSYPEADHRGAYGEALGILRDEGLARVTAGLEKLVRQLEEDDLLDLQSRYVHLFDRGRALSLHLYEHVHGESRDRGAAMVELVELYAQHGLALGPQELPDYLPVFLEFLSIPPIETAIDLLGEAGHVIEALAERLRKRKSPYAAAMAALASLVGRHMHKQARDALLQQPDEDVDDLEALDRVWAEEPVQFGPDQSGCPQARDMLAQMAGGVR